MTLNFFKRLFKRPPPTELEKRQAALADYLSGMEPAERAAALMRLSESDPELYESWIARPYGS